MTNPPAFNELGELDPNFDYCTWARHLIETLLAGPELDMIRLTISIPSRSMVVHRETELVHAWPQLAQNYRSLDADATATAQVMTPMFLRSLADLIESVGQDHFQARMNSLQKAAKVMQPPQATPTGAGPHQFGGLMTPSSSNRHPSTSSVQPTQVVPTHYQSPGGHHVGNEQAGTPPNRVNSFGPQMLTPTPRPREINPSNNETASRTTTYPYIPPSQSRPYILGSNRPSDTTPSPASFSTYRRGQAPQNQVQGSRAASRPQFNPNPFQHSDQGLTLNTRAPQLSASSTSFQSQASRSTSTRSQGGLFGTGGSATMPGRRPMGHPARTLFQSEPTNRNNGDGNDGSESLI